MITTTLQEKLDFYSTVEGEEEISRLLEWWMTLTTDEKVAYVSKRIAFTTPNRLKVYIRMVTLQKQILGIQRFPRGKRYDDSEYDVREHDITYYGKAEPREDLDMFVIQTNDGERNILLKVRILVTFM